jgi:fatty-acyl-CoA synthase
MSEIETIVGRLPGVGLVAVIGSSDAKWGERPVLVVEPRKGHVLDEKALLAVLRGNVADWWIPDQVVQVNEMPLSATGKIRLRAEHGRERETSPDELGEKTHSSKNGTSGGR